MARRINLDKSSILPEQCFDKIKTRGRPKLKLNDIGKEIVTKLAGFMCTEEEIASFLGVSVEQLKNDVNKDSFTECVKNGQRIGKVSLRQNQFNLSKTNASMAIFLGKQYLGQKDVVDDGSNEKDALDKLCDAIKGAVNDD